MSGSKTVTRAKLRELAVHGVFMLGENPQDVDEFLASWLEETYFASLAQEDELSDLCSAIPADEGFAFLRHLLIGIAEHMPELDGYIEKYAKGWEIGRISRTAVAVMRVSMFEILYMPDIPNRVAINEAVELAKHYDDEEVVAFVNGVLGSFIKQEMDGELPGQNPEKSNG